MKINSLLILFGIIVFSGFLRFYKLTQIPPALYWDEASIAYNAYSILVTGKDEHANPFPLTHFLAYGDAKPPLYIYAVTASFFLFSPTDFAVRFPSAFAGVLAVGLTYFLCLELHRFFVSSDKPDKPKFPAKTWAVTASLLLAISPWHLQMSRSAFEANLALTLFLLGTVLFFQGFRHPRRWFLAACFYVATLYTFNAYRIFLPLFVLFLGLITFRRLLVNPTKVIAPLILGILLTLPLIPFLLSSQAQLRLNEVSIFNNHEPATQSTLYRELNHFSFPANILFNRRVFYALDFIRHYTDHFKLDFLFFSGDVNPRLSVRDLGELYLIELPLLLLGIFLLVRSRSGLKIFLLAWVLLGIVPAAVARETPHALRILQVLPVPQIVIAGGITFLYARKRKIAVFILCLYLLSFSGYLELYYRHYQVQWADSWQYGYRQLVDYLAPIYQDYDRIYVTNSLGRPHTYLLWYLKYDPVFYWQNRDAGGDAFGFTFTNSFDRFYFSDPESLTPESGQKWLLVTRAPDYPPNSTPIHTIYDLIHQPIFVITSLN